MRRYDVACLGRSAICPNEGEISVVIIFTMADSHCDNDTIALHCVCATVFGKCTAFLGCRQ